MNGVRAVYISFGIVKIVVLFSFIDIVIVDFILSIIGHVQFLVDDFGSQPIPLLDARRVPGNGGRGLLGGVHGLLVQPGGQEHLCIAHEFKFK
jgi:hypothetical protein